VKELTWLGSGSLIQTVEKWIIRDVVLESPWVFKRWCIKYSL